MSAIAAAAPQVGALMSRAKNELIRVPGAAIPGVLAPTIFYLGLNAVFGALTDLRGFGAVDYQSFIIPVSMLQGAGFTGAATGVNLARDIESGWFDRLLASPSPRWVILGGMVAAAAVRSLIPAFFLLVIAFAIGASFPGILGLLIAVVGVMGMSTAAACWGCSLALKFRTQSAAPLMQSGMFVAVLFTSSYAPLALLEPWLRTVAEINPVTQVLEMTRQGFIGPVTFADTWLGLVVLVALIAVLGAFALRGMRRMAD
ncbi:ABC transporter permease [Thermoleophilia bacterium SCSIO 60948]|nr:ABC transporter permease [Thermoleophilia bacterium SCSIO 60948]